LPAAGGIRLSPRHMTGLLISRAGRRRFRSIPLRKPVPGASAVLARISYDALLAGRGPASFRAGLPSSGRRTQSTRRRGARVFRPAACRCPAIAASPRPFPVVQQRCRRARSLRHACQAGESRACAILSMLSRRCTMPMADPLPDRPRWARRTISRHRSGPSFIQGHGRR